MMQLPITAQVFLNICRAETGFVVTVHQSPNQRVPKVYAGSSLDELVKIVLGEIVAGKLEE
jgi:hypothetical protein